MLSCVLLNRRLGAGLDLCDSAKADAGRDIAV
jgi:hypothetical protein